MQHTSEQEGLIGTAQAVLGDEPVIAAGVFALAGPALGAGTVASRPAASTAATTQLLVAATEEHIYVLRWATGPAQDRIVRTFDRATTEVQITTFGLSRIVSLEDPATDAKMQLHASVVRGARHSRSDRDLLRLLAAA
jgi:hypothetical protein